MAPKISPRALAMATLLILIACKHYENDTRKFQSRIKIVWLFSFSYIYFKVSNAAWLLMYET